MSLEALLSRLDPRPNGQDRWRCACPVCGGSNKSTLSIGVGDTGAVLLKCWKEGCSPEAIAGAVGLAIAELFPPKPEAGHGAAPMKRRRLITAGQALDVLDAEMYLAIICASEMARGEALNDTTRERLLKGAARISMIREEVRA